MELEQIIKRLEWLDDERRKEKTTIATLEGRIVSLEGNIPSLLQQVRDINSEVTRIASLLSRFDQIESSISQVRVELTRSIESIEKQRAEQTRDVEKSRRGELEVLNKTIADVKKGLDVFPEMKVAIQARVEEDYRLGRLIEELEHKVVEDKRSEEEYKRSLRMLEEGRRQDTKRITDTQGEIAAFRKRQDELRGKIDLALDSNRKYETRLNEMQGAEGERRQLQTAFFDKHNMLQVERERIWKEWQIRFDVIEKQAVNLDNQLQALDTIQRAVKRSQEAFEEITQRFERRINEITEMQRLNDDRFRSEWQTFRNDELKKWTNYNLIQEEQQKESLRQFEKIFQRLVVVEELSQDFKDDIQIITEETKKRLLSLLAFTHELVDNFERTLGSNH